MFSAREGAGGTVELRILVQPPVVSKVYPRDHLKLEFPEQSNHLLTAPALEPFLTTCVRSLFPLGFVRLSWFVRGDSYMGRKIWTCLLAS
jgi:hypothetical protein